MAVVEGNIDSWLRHLSGKWFCCCVQLLSLVYLCCPKDCSMPAFPVRNYLSEFTQIHVHWVGGAIQLSHLLLPSSPLFFNLFQHRGLFQWVSSWHQVVSGCGFWEASFPATITSSSHHHHFLIFFNYLLLSAHT